MLKKKWRWRKMKKDEAGGSEADPQEIWTYNNTGKKTYTNKQTNKQNNHEYDPQNSVLKNLWWCK